MPGYIDLITCIVFEFLWRDVVRCRARSYESRYDDDSTGLSRSYCGTSNACSLRISGRSMSYLVKSRIEAHSSQCSSQRREGIASQHQEKTPQPELLKTCTAVGNLGFARACKDTSSTDKQQHWHTDGTTRNRDHLVVRGKSWKNKSGTIICECLKRNAAN